MKNIKQITIGALMVVTLLSGSLVTFAKENDRGNSGRGNEKNNRPDSVLQVNLREYEVKNNESKDRKDVNAFNTTNEQKKDRGCLRAFGHLIAPGWVKHNGLVNWNLECHLPLGISKKFQGNNATSTATSTTDLTAPVIANVAFPRIAIKGAEVRWSTNEKSDSTVYFGTTTSVDTSSSARVVSNDRRVTDHQMVIRNLTASTTYYIVVRSRDASGNVATSDTYSFVTRATSTDTVTPIISGVAAVTSTSTIQIGWSTNEPANSKVYYATSTPVGTASTTLNVANSTLVTNHTVVLPGLATSTLYYFVVQSADASGNVATSTQFATTTLAI